MVKDEILRGIARMLNRGEKDYSVMDCSEAADLVKENFSLPMVTLVIVDNATKRSIQMLEIPHHDRWYLYHTFNIDCELKDVNDDTEYIDISSNSCGHGKLTEYLNKINETNSTVFLFSGEPNQIIQEDLDRGRFDVTKCEYAREYIYKQTVKTNLFGK